MSYVGYQVKCKLQRVEVKNTISEMMTLVAFNRNEINGA